MPTSLVTAGQTTTLRAGQGPTGLIPMVVAGCAHADQLEAEVLDEVRAARRDALLHSIASVRPRRAVRP